MAFITDRDLLMFEPTLCRDAGWVAAELASGTGTVSAGDVSIAGVDPGARGIGIGQLAVIREEVCEITAVPGAGTVGGVMSLSLPRSGEMSPRVAPADGTGPCRVLTFARHIDAAHEMVLQQLGIADLVASDLLHESRITRTSNLKLVEACMALELIWGAAAGAAGANSGAGQRSDFYGLRANALAVLATAEFAGGPVGTKIRLSTGARRFVRG